MRPTLFPEAMRKLLRRFLPDHDKLRANRWLAIFGDTLLHPRLWHINRHSAAGAVAVGLFCGLIPGPFQMLGAAIACIVLRVNLPLALLTTLYTNPLTIVPLYFVAYEMGRLVIPASRGFVAPPEFDAAHFGPWVQAILDWTAGLGKPLALGVLMLASLLAVLGYLCVRAIYRWYLVRAWHSRKARGR
ncbi:MAG: DUF2062 domain-containing protein [Rhodocyclaceae bacterium]